MDISLCLLLSDATEATYRTHAALNGLQIFAPTPEAADHCVASQAVPLEVLVDYRCESTEFDRLVPQTDAILQYDKFNRLRLRNKISSVVPSLSDENFQVLEHLQHQTVSTLSFPADCELIRP